MMDMAFKKNLLDISSTWPQSSYPRLLHGIKGEDERILHCISEERLFSTKISYLSNKFVWDSRDGWWLVQDLANKAGFFILNPTSMERIELPKLESSSQSFVGCMILNSPKNANCRVILFDDSHNVLSCQIGDFEFNTQVLGGEKLYSVTVFGGRIYGLLEETHGLVRISFEGQTLEIMEVIRGRGREEMSSGVETAGVIRFQSYLVESNDEILHVHKVYAPSLYSRETADFKIHKMDSSSFEWKEVKTLGDGRALFLDETGGISCKVDEEERGEIQGNCIYHVDSHSHHVGIFDFRDGAAFPDLFLSSSSSSSSPCKQYGNHVFRWVRLPPA